ncbi:hypothetical protein GCM10023081_20040 [Arthrobacter ginkgonis]|uniref:SGNH hydrolase-type esterase domain-containing protein n=1 Tax=Arthrobacter ginkgonis TaxID=1630594 RepID=A0ABP7C9J3_9MICC
MAHAIPFDLRSGTGVPASFITGTIEVEPTAMHTSGTALVLPEPTKVGITAGTATLDLEPSPEGEDPAWAYKVTIRSASGRAWAEYVSVPAGTGPTAYTALPRLTTSPAAPPLTTWHQIVEELQSATQAAVDAANLVGAPAGIVVRTTVEGDLDNPVSGIATRLNAAIDGATLPKVSKVRLAPGVKVPGGRVCYFAGDSITDGAGSTNVSRSYRLVTPRIAGTAYISSVNGGVPGQRTDQINARIPAMITAGANIIVYMGGTNDASQAVPLATFQTNIIAAHKLAQDAEIPFILNTVPAVGKGSANDARHALTTAYNSWIKLWAPTQGIPVADVYTATADPTDGRLRTEYEQTVPDGTHPGNAGHLAIANAVAPVIRSIIPTRVPVVTVKGAGLISDPLGANANWWDTWTRVSAQNDTGSGWADPVAGDGLTVGRWFKGNVDNSAGSSYKGSTFRTYVASNTSQPGKGWAPGDVLGIYFKVKTSSTTGEGIKVAITNQTEVVQTVVFDEPSSAAPGPQYATFTVPASGMTAVGLSFSVTAKPGEILTGYIGQVDVFNLTKLGLA